MATRRKPPAKTPLTEAAFTVVLEDLRSKFNVFGESLMGVREELHSFRGEVDRRFGQVELALLEHSREIRQFGGVLEDVQGELGNVWSELGNVRGELRNVWGELGNVRATVTRIEAALETKVDREEVVSIVERALARR